MIITKVETLRCGVLHADDAERYGAAVGAGAGDRAAREKRGGQRRREDLGAGHDADVVAQPLAGGSPFRGSRADCEPANSASSLSSGALAVLMLPRRRGALGLMSTMPCCVEELRERSHERLELVMFVGSHQADL